MHDAIEVAFRKSGDTPTERPGSHVLAAIGYGTTPVAPFVADHGGIELEVPMVAAGGGFTEFWTTNKQVTTGQIDGVRYAHDGEHLLCAGRIPPAPRYADQTEHAYLGALRTMRELGYPHLSRIWNFIGRINEDNADGVETYRDFCLGRARAFEHSGTPTEKLCAATGVGAMQDGVSFYSLSRRSDVHTHLENPRQVAAYRYPAQYGPKSPSFSRATHIRDAGHLYVSGTASIIGHETVHHGLIERQCETALGNIAQVIGDANAARHGLPRGYRLTDLDLIKVYVRHEEHVEIVRELCAAAFSPDAEIAFFTVDICRSDLLVEIEGIVR